MTTFSLPFVVSRVIVSHTLCVVRDTLEEILGGISKVFLDVFTDFFKSVLYCFTCVFVCEGNTSGACTSASGTSCQITIDADDTTATTNLLVIDDMTVEGAETAIVRVEVDSGSAHLVQEGSPSSLNFNIAADPPANTIKFPSSTLTANEGLAVYFPETTGLITFSMSYLGCETNKTSQTELVVDLGLLSSSSSVSPPHKPIQCFFG